MAVLNPREQQWLEELVCDHVPRARETGLAGLQEALTRQYVSFGRDPESAHLSDQTELVGAMVREMSCTESFGAFHRLCIALGFEVTEQQLSAAAHAESILSRHANKRLRLLAVWHTAETSWFFVLHSISAACTMLIESGIDTVTARDRKRAQQYVVTNLLRPLLVFADNNNLLVLATKFALYPDDLSTLQEFENDVQIMLHENANRCGVCNSETNLTLVYCELCRIQVCFKCDCQCNIPVCRAMVHLSKRIHK